MSQITLDDWDTRMGLHKLIIPPHAYVEMVVHDEYANGQAGKDNKKMFYYEALSKYGSYDFIEAKVPQLSHIALVSRVHKDHEAD